MSPEQIQLVLASYGEVRGDESVPARFYELLFLAEPSAQPLFAHLPATGAKFAQELEVLTESLSDHERFEARALALGARHRGYGVGARHYAAAREALVQALAERLGPAFSDETAAAWRAAFDLMAETMMDGAGGREPA